MIFILKMSHFGLLPGVQNFFQKSTSVIFLFVLGNAFMQNFKKNLMSGSWNFFGSDERMDGGTKKQTGLKSWDPSTKAGVQLNEWDLEGNVFLISS